MDTFVRNDFGFFLQFFTFGAYKIYVFQFLSLVNINDYYLIPLSYISKPTRLQFYFSDSKLLIFNGHRRCCLVGKPAGALG
jgi:hypothetical protein